MSLMRATIACLFIALLSCVVEAKSSGGNVPCYQKCEDAEEAAANRCAYRDYACIDAANQQQLVCIAACDAPKLESSASINKLKNMVKAPAGPQQCLIGCQNAEVAAEDNCPQQEPYASNCIAAAFDQEQACEAACFATSPSVSSSSASFSRSKKKASSFPGNCSECQNKCIAAYRSGVSLCESIGGNNYDQCIDSVVAPYFNCTYITCNPPFCSSKMVLGPRSPSVSSLSRSKKVSSFAMNCSECEIKCGDAYNSGISSCESIGGSNYDQCAYSVGTAYFYCYFNTCPLTCPGKMVSGPRGRPSPGNPQCYQLCQNSWESSVAECAPNDQQCIQNADSAYAACQIPCAQPGLLVKSKVNPSNKSDPMCYSTCYNTYTSALAACTGNESCTEYAGAAYKSCVLAC